MAKLNLGYPKARATTVRNRMNQFNMRLRMDSDLSREGKQHLADLAKMVEELANGLEHLVTTLEQRIELG